MPDLETISSTQSAGAIERDFFEAVAAGLTFDTRPELGNCVMWLLFILLLIVFIVTFFIR